MQAGSIRRHAFITALLASVTLIAACQPETSPAEPSASDMRSAASIAEAYTNAYNRGDIDAMAALMHPEIEWYAEDDGEMVLIASGKDALVKDVSAYFENGQTTTSLLSDVRITETGIEAVETVSWTSEDG
ncbi:MAG: nuclear transport factor 2 family protein, partial [Henriciella sp.]|uniref:nuclear transport factor 2 family protein n=1 Tax=Henriciella sp. TaxID=1968823 RepID=UPI003C70CEE5